MTPSFRVIDSKLHLALAFAIPWNGTSIIFVTLSSLLLAGIESRSVLLPISLIGTFFLALWLFNYAFEVLDHAANGSTIAPIASIEVLSPFQWRPLVIVAICFLIVVLGSKLGATGNVIIILPLLVLPASIATLGMGGSALQAANPFTLWRITVGMGAYYLLVLALIGLFVALAVTLQTAHLWAFVRYALLEIGILTVFAVLGTSIFLRRIEVGFEPRSSPERTTERDVGEHQRQLDEILDEAYGQSRLKDYERAAFIIKRWLSNTDKVGIANDVKVILQRVRGWGDPAAFNFIERAIGASAGNKDQPPARHW
jgi:hypothetical protein